MFMLGNKRNKKNIHISSSGSCAFSFIRRKLSVFPKAVFFYFFFSFLLSICKHYRINVSFQKRVFKYYGNWRIALTGSSGIWLDQYS